MSLPSTVRIVEVGPRDGLQSIEKEVSTEHKVNFINILSTANLPEIEVTSFVSSKWIPQMSDASEVSSQITRDDSITYTALVPNAKGLERALENEYKSVAIFTAASETFSQKNTNCSIDQSFQRFEEMKPAWEKNKLRVRAYISTCWICPYEGTISPDQVLPVVQKLLDLGISEISLGETIGKAEPEDVEILLDTLLKAFSPSQFALHFHDTFGHAVENIRTGLNYGIATYDSSAGGVGGCPYAPGASGNVSTEAVADLCEELGIETGIHRGFLTEAGYFIRAITDDRETVES